MYKIYFDGYGLHDFCIINNAYPESKPDGSKIELRVDITIKDNVRYNIDMLNRILFTDDYKKITLSSQPDRYLMCKLKGDVQFSHWFKASKATLTFEAESHYWLQEYDQEPPNFYPDEQGVITVDNNGSAPTFPEMSFRFPSDNGYFGIIAPNGYIELGNPEEKDDMTLPSTHRVMNEEMHLEDMSDWTKITSNNHAQGKWVGDYDKLNIGTGDPGFDQWGTKLTKSTRPLSGYYWNAWAYVKGFEEHEALPAQEFNNFRLESRIRFEDLSGTTNNTGMYLIVVMDEMNKPIMTTSFYNVDSNTNTVTVTAKINDFKGSGHTSQILHTAKFPRGFNGSIKMTKERDSFHWYFDSKKDQSVAGTSTQVVETFNIGNIAYIRNSATHYYHHNGAKFAVASFTRGRKNWISNSRIFNGRRQYEISVGNTKIAWLYAEDLTKDPRGVGETRRQQAISGNRTSEFRTINSQLAGLVAKKVLVVGGTWDSSNPFTNANITAVIVDRINNGARFKDVKNTFNAGDLLTINNKTSEILLNGATYQGYIDPASRFFDIDFGQTDIQLLKSNWADMPRGKLQIEERWR